MGFNASLQGVNSSAEMAFNSIPRPKVSIESGISSFTDLKSQVLILESGKGALPSVKGTQAHSSTPQKSSLSALNYNPPGTTSPMPEHISNYSSASLLSHLSSALSLTWRHFFEIHSVLAKQNTLLL